MAYSDDVPGTPIPEISQDAQELNLRWRAHDPVDLSWKVKNADWSGTYRAEVRNAPNRAGQLLGTFVVTATYDAPSAMTQFRLQMADSSQVKGDAWWDLQQASGPTRLAGRVFVVPDVTA